LPEPIESIKAEGGLAGVKHAITAGKNLAKIKD